MSLLKEISDLFRFSFKTPKEDKEIVIYSEHEGYYVNFEGLIDELTNNHNKTISYITSDPNDPIFKSKNKKIKAFYIKSYLPFVMSLIKCKVFIMTLTDLNQFHLKRSANPVHYVYVFHSMVSTHMMYRKGAFDHYDSILCTGPHQIEEIRKYESMNKLKPKALIEAGYYRLGRIISNYKKYRDSNPASKEPKTLLIAPSWGKNNIFESCGEKLIDILLKSGFEVIARPHPETIRRSPEIINSIFNKFSKNASFTFEKSVSSDDSLLKSDILICDCSGIALEYAFGTERPVLFLDVPYKMQNDEYKNFSIEPLELSIRKKIGIIHKTADLENLPKIIKQMHLNNKYIDEIRKLREKYIFHAGESSKIGSDYILELLSK